MTQETMNPIRDCLLALLDEEPMLTQEQLLSRLPQLSQDFLTLSVSQGDIVQTRKGKYCLPEAIGLIRARLQGNARGFGFAIPTKAGQADIYIPADAMGGALHGDIVLAHLVNSTRREGEIARILEHVNDVIVGTLEEDGLVSYIVPDEKKISTDIYISREDRMGAKDGQKVVVRVIKWIARGRNPRAKIIEILGDKEDIQTDIRSIIRQHHLEEEFSAQTLAAVQSMPTQVSASDLQDREDMRALCTFTIDGATAKDFDDAVSISRTDDGGYVLSVHIADVSHYVRPAGPIDEDARSRATSVYLLGKVLPMLPEELSNGLCSLNPDVDRLTLSCQMNVSSGGDVTMTRIFPSVIRSHARLVYEDVTAFLTGETHPMYAAKVEQSLKVMEELAAILTQKRLKRGALDLNIDESHILLDDAGNPVQIEKAQRGIANRIIEEFMLLANESVAQFAKNMEIPLLYRVHETPDPLKLQTFETFLQNLNYKIKGGKNGLHPKALQEVLTRAQGTNEEGVISRLMLRSLQKARYADQPLGHFGLAAPDYCHFTSPIRRYPDLIVHRALRDYLRGVDNLSLAAQLPDLAVHCSERERNAMEAERDVDDLRKAQYMYGHVGEKFDGIISAVTNFGFFVQLENTVEGLVHITTLDDDYYNFIETQYLLIGERRKKSYRLGDPVRVTVSQVDISARRIDFAVDD